MYLNKAQVYFTPGGEQRCRKAPFLLLWSDDCGKTLYVFVRHVALRQLGQFMMGFARVEGKTISVSGAYGNDGLPLAPEKLPRPKDAVQVPQELRDAWNNGGGWNGAGSEADMMRKWVRYYIAINSATRLKFRRS